jgi:hypothetical protein
VVTAPSALIVRSACSATSGTISSTPSGRVSCKSPAKSASRPRRTSERVASSAASSSHRCVSGFSRPDVAKSVNDGEPASSAATNTARHGASRACQASPSTKANVSVSPSSMGVRKYSRVTPMTATSSTNHAGCV